MEQDVPSVDHIHYRHIVLEAGEDIDDVTVPGSGVSLLLGRLALGDEKSSDQERII